MDIGKIKMLEEQLEELGFQDMQGVLLKRTCFLPDEFLVKRSLAIDEDNLDFCFYFKKDHDKYVIEYYDACLRKEIIAPDVNVKNINVRKLDETMNSIDWKTAFAFDELKSWDSDDKESWEKESKILSVVKDLQTLGMVDEGKLLAQSLKLKHWEGVCPPAWVEHTENFKNKIALTQRFYFPQNGKGITSNEAIRFLQNKWLEKIALDTGKKTPGKRAVKPAKKQNSTKKTSKNHGRMNEKTEDNE